MLLDSFREVLCCNSANIFNTAATEGLHIAFRIINNLTGLDGFEVRFKSRLCSGTENDTCAEISCKRFDTLDAGLQVFYRKLLYLIKDDNAVRDIMKLSAFSRLVGKETLKKLYIRRDDNRNIPVFGCVLKKLALLAVLKIKSGMVFQNILLSYNSTQYRSCLRCNCIKWDDDDDTLNTRIFRCRRNRISKRR